MRFGVSERRACRVVGQHRSTQRRQPPAATAAGAEACGPACGRSPGSILAGAGRPPIAIVRREGWTVNRKRTQRLWREEGLRRPQFCRKRRRLGPTLTGRLRASQAQSGVGHRLPVRRDR